jgi:cysteine synthase A
MIKVPDAASIAALHYLKKLTGRHFGGSTGTNFIGAFTLAKELEQEGRPASIVTLICDSGERYADTYYNQDWLNAQSIEYENAFHF